MTSVHQKPDIRQITRLVPPSGNLVQGQSELAINPVLARAASEIITASQNHYSPAEGVTELRRAVAEKIEHFNSVKVDPDAKPFELLITHGATGALTALAQQYLSEATTLVFEPYYPYHRRIFEEAGGRTETLPLHGARLELDPEELNRCCQELKTHPTHPLRAIIACTPVNPTGKVFTSGELELIAQVCQEYDLLCIADEVYEHFVVGTEPHISIASLPGMRERTVTVNSFSKSWNISGWRLGYVYGEGMLVAPLVNTNNVFYVCEATPLQKALARVLMMDVSYYETMRERFAEKRRFALNTLEQVGFDVYDSGSAFYIWARIPQEFGDANELNERLMKEAGVAGVPGSAFTDNGEWHTYMRFCVAREDRVLESAFGSLRKFFGARDIGAG